MTFDLLQLEIRQSGRRLIHDWPFTAAAVLILALGIGANTAMFSVINAALFRKSALAHPERLVDIYQNASNAGALDGNSYPAYLDIATYTDVFASTTAASVPIPVNYFEQGAMRAGVAEYTAASYLSVLGLRPFLGRWFDPAEDIERAPVVAVVSHLAWTRRFGSDGAIVGRTIRIDGVPVTIVGVGPAGHNGTINIGLVTDFWLPISALASMGAPPRVLERRPVESAFFVKARLRDGVTVAQAQSAMDILGVRLARDYPNEDPGKGITVKASTDVRIHPQLDTALRAFASVLLVVVGLVLAIACSNLATLLLVRGVARAREVSVRLALGATRLQLVRQLLTESLFLSLAGGILGCLVAWWGINALRTMELPVSVDFSLDYRVLVFAVALSFVTGIAFGLAPAFTATQIDLIPALRDDGGLRSADRRWFTLKNGLVVLQVVLSVILLSSASVFVQMVLAARAQRTGFAIDGVAILTTDARYAGYTEANATGVYQELRRRVASIPGVQSLGLTSGQPMVTNGLSIIVEQQNTPANVLVSSIWAGPGYFETLQMPILRGRAIDERDRAGTPRVAVISESMARRQFGDINATGRRFRIDQDPGWIEVVGIVRDTRTADLAGDLTDPAPSLVYRSPAQWDQASTTFVARSSLDAAVLLASMQQELRGLDTALPVVWARTMAQHLEDSLVAPRAVATSLGILGALGVSLAGIGLYAVVSFAVSRRSREIGIRMALGARSFQIVWSVARDVTVLVGAGTGIGLALSLIVIMLMRSSAAPAPGVDLYRPGIDPVALLAIAVFMTIVGLAAAFVPARRAATMDPLAALRHD
jgi:putative ABC transport system permease protein